MARSGWSSLLSGRPVEGSPQPHLPVVAAIETPPPATVRGVAEASEVLAVARLLRGGLTLVKAEALIERLSPYRERLFLNAGDPIAGLAESDRGRWTEATMRYLAPVVVDVLLPGASGYVLDRLIGRRGGEPELAAEHALPSAREVAQAMRELVGRFNGAGRRHLAAIARACESEARTRTDQRVGTGGAVDRRSIDDLASDLMRAEVLTMALETLGNSRGLEETRFQSLRLARHALRRAAETLESFVAEPGINTLYQSLSVLAAVDGLIVVVLRLLDAWSENPEERTPFVEPADHVSLGRYITAAGRLADKALGMIGRAAVTERVDDLFFEALVRQIALLHRFCVNCGHERRPLGMDVLQEQMVLRSSELAVFAGDALVAETMKANAQPAVLQRLLHRAEAIAELMEMMGRIGELEALAVRILAVRDTLGTVVPRV